MRSVQLSLKYTWVADYLNATFCLSIQRTKVAHDFSFRWWVHPSRSFPELFKPKTSMLITQTYKPVFLSPEWLPTFHAKQHNETFPSQQLEVGYVD